MRGSEGKGAFMDIWVSPLRLELAYEFRISRWSYRHRDNVVIRVEQDGLIGYGEAAPNARYDESAESCNAALARLVAVIGDRVEPYRHIMHRVNAAFPGEFAAKTALDMALLDLLGKRLGAPLYEILGLEPRGPMPISLTIGIDKPEMVAEKVREAAPFSVLKMKLGSGTDRELIRTVRRITSVPIRVDANEGWADREHAARELDWLAKQGIELVEQPMPALNREDMVWLKARSPLPLIADESLAGPEDLYHLRDQFHGVNVKLMKSGGILSALRTVESAKSLGMSIMLGCMIESGLAIGAAAQLASLVDYLDLDSNVLLRRDPFEGHPVEDGCLMVQNRPGLGVQPKSDQDFKWKRLEGQA